MITAVASLAKFDPDVKARTASIWQNTYLKAGKPSHGIMQDQMGRKIVVPKDFTPKAPARLRKREQGFLAGH